MDESALLCCGDGGVDISFDLDQLPDDHEVELEWDFHLPLSTDKDLQWDDYGFPPLQQMSQETSYNLCFEDLLDENTRNICLSLRPDPVEQEESIMNNEQMQEYQQKDVVFQLAPENRCFVEQTYATNEDTEKNLKETRKITLSLDKPEEKDFDVILNWVNSDVTCTELAKWCESSTEQAIVTRSKSLLGIMSEHSMYKSVNSQVFRSGSCASIHDALDLDCYSNVQPFIVTTKTSPCSATKYYNISCVDFEDQSQPLSKGMGEYGELHKTQTNSAWEPGDKAEVQFYSLESRIEEIGFDEIDQIHDYVDSVMACTEEYFQTYAFEDKLPLQYNQGSVSNKEITHSTALCKHSENALLEFLNSWSDIDMEDEESDCSEYTCITKELTDDEVDVLSKLVEDIIIVTSEQEKQDTETSKQSVVNSNNTEAFKASKELYLEEATSQCSTELNPGTVSDFLIPISKENSEENVTHFDCDSYQHLPDRTVLWGEVTENSSIKIESEANDEGMTHQKLHQQDVNTLKQPPDDTEEDKDDWWSLNIAEDIERSNSRNVTPVEQMNKQFPTKENKLLLPFREREETLDQNKFWDDYQNTFVDETGLLKDSSATVKTIDSFEDINSCQKSTVSERLSITSEYEDLNKYWNSTMPEEIKTPVEEHVSDAEEKSNDKLPYGPVYSEVVQRPQVASLVDCLKIENATLIFPTITQDEILDRNRKNTNKSQSDQYLNSKFKHQKIDKKIMSSESPATDLLTQYMKLLQSDRDIIGKKASINGNQEENMKLEPDFDEAQCYLPQTADDVRTDQFDTTDKSSIQTETELSYAKEAEKAEELQIEQIIIDKDTYDDLQMIKMKDTDTDYFNSQDMIQDEFLDVMETKDDDYVVKSLYEYLDAIESAIDQISQEDMRMKEEMKDESRISEISEVMRIIDGESETYFDASCSVSEDVLDENNSIFENLITNSDELNLGSSSSDSVYLEILDNSTSRISHVPVSNRMVAIDDDCEVLVEILSDSENSARNSTMFLHQMDKDDEGIIHAKVLESEAKKALKEFDGPSQTELPNHEDTIYITEKSSKEVDEDFKFKQLAEDSEEMTELLGKESKEQVTSNATKDRDLKTPEEVGPKISDSVDTTMDSDEEYREADIQINVKKENSFSKVIDKFKTLNSKISEKCKKEEFLTDISTEQTPLIPEAPVLDEHSESRLEEAIRFFNTKLSKNYGFTLKRSTSSKTASKDPVLTQLRRTCSWDSQNMCKELRRTRQRNTSKSQELPNTASVTQVFRNHRPRGDTFRHSSHTWITGRK